MDEGASATGLRPLGLGEILDVAIKLFRNNFVPLVKAVAVVTVPVQVASAIALESATLDPDDWERVEVDQFGNTIITTEVDAGQIWAFFAALLATVVLSLLAAQLASGACFRLIAGAYLDERPTWRESLSFALSKLRSLVWLGILSGLLMVLGFLACVVPGVYLYGAWAVAIPVLLLEDRRGFKALSRSRDLVKGRWWPVAGALLLSSILAAIVTGALSALFTVPFDLLFESDAVLTVTSTIGGTLAALIATPFSAAVIIVLYVDLRVRREGFDLELLAQRMGSAPPTGPPPAAIFGTRMAVPPPEGGSGTGGSGEEPPYWPPPPGWKPSRGTGSSLPPPPRPPDPDGG